MKIKLSKPYKFEDQPETFTELDISLDGLKGDDIITCIDHLAAQGHVMVSPALDSKLQASIAAQAMSQPVEFIKGLPAPDFMKVCQKVQNFLLV